MAKKKGLTDTEAMVRGLTLEEYEVLVLAVEYFDGSYRAFMDHLKTLGATPNVYFAVNAAIKETVGKGRPNVDVWNLEELEGWGDGYTYSTEAVTKLSHAAIKAKESFEQMMIERGWRRGY